MKLIILSLAVLFSLTSFCREYPRQYLQNSWGELNVENIGQMRSRFFFEPYRKSGHILILHRSGLIAPICPNYASITKPIKVSTKTKVIFNAHYPEHRPGSQAQIRGIEIDYLGAQNFYRVCFYSFSKKDSTISLINDSLLVSTRVDGD